MTKLIDLGIGYDHKTSTEGNARYYVYNIAGEIIYNGSYVQCLVVVGAIALHPDYTLQKINEKSNGFLEPLR